jgi:beta-glucosidase
MKLNIDSKSSLKDIAKNLVAQMSLEEKAGFCSGKDCWTMRSLERLGIDSIMMSDGPHGLRKQIGENDNLGIGDSVPSVCFPTASALACSFDRDLVYQVGKAIGEECVQEGVSVLLGPGVNQKRSPLCGRNFEYYSEDPTLSGELGASWIQGVQSTGTSTSLKHFAVNNQERRRMTINAVVDERTLRETYLKAFEIAVKKGKPDTVMCAYNKLNGEYCSENSYLLTAILRNEWGFNGAVVSDWGAVCDRVRGVRAGLNIEMPGCNGLNDAKIVTAINNKDLSEEVLNQVVERSVELILKGMLHKREGFRYDAEQHHKLATKADEESAVLLKNEDNLLPGNRKQKVAIIGEFAKNPRYQGAGSSKIHPIKVESAWEVFHEYMVDAAYAKGYQLTRRSPDKVLSKKEALEKDQLIREACEVAKGKDIVYIFAGLPEGYESEGFDRQNLSMPMEQNHLIEAVSECNPNVVVILYGGAPMELTWLSKVKAVLLAYLGGEAVQRAITNLLLGEQVPCGKLAETWPLCIQDTPSYDNFPGNRLTVEYRESIFVGYRYYDTAKKEVLFPFGHGLSYTSFEYSNLSLSKAECHYGDQITVTFQIRNTGTRKAKETVFVFVGHKNSQVFLPEKELREFIKVELEVGETKQVAIALDTSTLGYYNRLIHDWYAESGSYEILVGPSSNHCPLTVNLQLISPEQPQPDDRITAPCYYQLTDHNFSVSKKEFEVLYQSELPSSDLNLRRPYHKNQTLEDVNHTFIGKVVLMVAEFAMKRVTKASKEEYGMMSAAIREMPFYALVTSGDGMISEHMMEGIIEMLNGHYLRGIKKLIKK